MKNWKTSLFGALTACGVGLTQSSDPILHTIGLVLGILGPVLLGASAKDLNVTGGTVQQ